MNRRQCECGRYYRLRPDGKGMQRQRCDECRRYRAKASKNIAKTTYRHKKAKAKANAKALLSLKVYANSRVLDSFAAADKLHRLVSDLEALLTTATGPGNGRQIADVAPGPTNDANTDCGVA